MKTILLWALNFAVMPLFRLPLKEKQFCYLEYFGTKFDESDNEVNEVVMQT